MNSRKLILPVAMALLLCGQASAQSEEERMAEEVESREAEYAQRMREAEERLAEAAQRVAELSAERLNRYGDSQRFVLEFSDKPRLGVNVGDDTVEGPVEGVRIISVTPGSAAEDAGLRAGDIITAVNEEPMSAESSLDATKLLLDFMHGVEEGDVLKVEYLRDDKVGSVELEPRPVSPEAFAWSGRGMPPVAPLPEVHAIPQMVQRFRYGGWRGGWGDMEVVELTEDLGRYFAAESGLLVISAPKSNAFKLRDGDVILSIDGREPSSVNHCMRILGSYQPGEKLVLNIMRDKKREKLEIEVPDDRTGRLVPDAQGFDTLRAHADFRLRLRAA